MSVVVVDCSLPTDRLPTMAIFRCFGGVGMISNIALLPAVLSPACPNEAEVKE